MPRLLHAGARVIGGLARGVAATLSLLLTSTACAFLPAKLTYPLAAATLASGQQPQQQPLQRLQRALTLLRPLRQAVVTCGCLRVVLPLLLPGVWRGVMYWQRSLPILAGYFRTRSRTRRMLRRGDSPELVQAAWTEQHERGADQLFDMLADIQGFYLKLGQILATKTDMLPPAYTHSLSRLLDRLSPAPWPRVRHVIERELHRKTDEVFASVDTFPLASATVAQVHTARLAGPAGAQVAIKVQHKGVRRAMRADLANMRLFVEICDLAKVDLGFDLGSVVREYQVAVPMEFRFDHEAAAMARVRSSLRHRAATDLPALRHVIVPKVYPELSTDKVLVMQLLDGVPLLHTAGLDPAIKHSLMKALVMAFGVQILEDGFFHTDPHGGNLVACMDDIGDLAVGLLDFGQVKSLTNQERLRYARLVLAMASRNGRELRTLCRELGIRIENCDPGFEEIAAYILFDTRMDMPEALESPMDPAAHPGWRTARVPKLPRDLFMIMRVITLLRGVLASMGVHDVSSALLWQPLAERVVSELDAAPLAKKPSKHTTRLVISSHVISDHDLIAASVQAEEDSGRQPLGEVHQDHLSHSAMQPQLSPSSSIRYPAGHAAAAMTGVLQSRASVTSDVRHSDSAATIVDSVGAALLSSCDDALSLAYYSGAGVSHEQHTHPPQQARAYRRQSSSSGISLAPHFQGRTAGVGATSTQEMRTSGDQQWWPRGDSHPQVPDPAQTHAEPSNTLGSDPHEPLPPELLADGVFL